MACEKKQWLSCELKRRLFLVNSCWLLGFVGCRDLEVILRTRFGRVLYTTELSAHVCSSHLFFFVLDFHNYSNSQAEFSRVCCFLSWQVHGEYSSVRTFFPFMLIIFAMFTSWFSTLNIMCFSGLLWAFCFFFFFYVNLVMS